MLLVLVRGGDSPPQQTGSAWSPSSVVLDVPGYITHTGRQLLTAQHAEDLDDTLFSLVTHSSNHLLHVLLPEHTNHPYHLRSRTHSFKLSAQHDDRNFIDRMLLIRQAYSVCVKLCRTVELTIFYSLDCCICIILYFMLFCFFKFYFSSQFIYSWVLSSVFYTINWMSHSLLF